MAKEKIVMEEQPVAEITVDACDIARHENHIRILTALEKNAESDARRITTLEENYRILSELVASVKVLANEVATMGKTLSAANNRLDCLEQKPAKRYDLIVTILITAALSGTVGYLIHLLTEH